MVSTLSTRYAVNKAKLKKAIHENCQQWLVIGELFRVIKESGDWKQDCSSWDDFCQKAADYTKRFVDQLIADVKVWKPLSEMLVKMGNTLPTLTERTIQEIGKINGTEAQAEVVIEAQKTSGRVNSGTIKKVVTKRAKARVVSTQPHLSLPTHIAEPADDEVPSTGPTEPEIEEKPKGISDDTALELSAMVSNRVTEITGQPITESEDADLAIVIGQWLVRTLSSHLTTTL